MKGRRNLASPKFRSKRRCRKGITLAFCTHSFQVPLLLGMVPCGKRTFPGMAPPSQGLVDEDWDGIQTKVGFQLAGELALSQPPPSPFSCLAGIPCRLLGSSSQLRCLFTCCYREGVRALWGGLQNRNCKTHLSFIYIYSVKVGKILPFWLGLGNLKQKM